MSGASTRAAASSYSLVEPGGSSGKRQQNAGGVAVLAYGTALRRAGGTA